MSIVDSSVSRRHFLQGSGAAAGTFTIVAPQTVRGTEANSKVSVGLIGCGGRGSYDAGIVHNDSRAHITALCDLFEDRREGTKRGLKLERPAEFEDFEKLLASDVDAVIIATPPFEHPRMLAAAVEAKKHIYCEKPMGVDVEGCKRVIATGRRCDPKKNISVGFQQRYGPVYLDAYKRVQEGQIGELVAARAYWIGGDPFTRKPYSDPKVEHLRNWFCYKDTSGDFIVEQDCHNFDVLHWFLGLPTRVAGYGGTQGADLDGDPGSSGPGLRVSERHPSELRGQPDVAAGYRQGRRGIRGTERHDHHVSRQDGFHSGARMGPGGD